MWDMENVNGSKPDIASGWRLGTEVTQPVYRFALDILDRPRQITKARRCGLKRRGRFILL